MHTVSTPTPDLTVSGESNNAALYIVYRCRTGERYSAHPVTLEIDWERSEGFLEMSGCRGKPQLVNAIHIVSGHVSNICKMTDHNCNDPVTSSTVQKACRDALDESGFTDAFGTFDVVATRQDSNVSCKVTFPTTDDPTTAIVRGHLQKQIALVVGLPTLPDSDINTMIRLIAGIEAQVTTRFLSPRLIQTEDAMKNSVAGLVSTALDDMYPGLGFGVRPEGVEGVPRPAAKSKKSKQAANVFASLGD